MDDAEPLAAIGRQVAQVRAGFSLGAVLLARVEDLGDTRTVAVA